ncbi:MAG: hypothetical protein ACTSUO_06845 [Candidatus Thorarchaeota archaeon]
MDKTTLDLIEDLLYSVDRKLDSSVVHTKFVSSLRKTLEMWTLKVRPHLLENKFDGKGIEELSILFRELSDLHNIGRDDQAMKDLLSQISDCLRSDFAEPLRKRLKR